MRTIFRSVNLALLLAAVLAVAAVAAFAQDPCTDTAGMNDLDAKVRAAWADKTLTGKQNFVTAGKQFLEKYGACKGQEDFVTWLNAKVPDTETNVIPKMREAEVKTGLLKRYDAGIKAKNWDEVFAAGKEILAKFPDEFRPVEVDLASFGGELALSTNEFKYADDTIRFAKQSIADLDAGKPFLVGGKTAIGSTEAYGFKDKKDQAGGWLNLYVGYLMAAGKKDRVGALPYLYKASLAPASSDPKVPSASSRPAVYELIGDYYYDELGKLVEQIKTKIADQKDTDTAEVAKQKADEIKGLVAMSYGYAERAMDAYGRASANTTDPKYKTRIKTRIDNAYKVRFGKDTGSDAWVATAITKPFVNPQTPVAPIVEAEPAAAPSGVGAASGAGAGTGSGAGTGTGSGSSKPATTTPVSNPAPAKPADGTTAKPPAKSQTSAKKTLAKKSA